MGAELSDLEITRLCAEAMGLHLHRAWSDRDFDSGSRGIVTNEAGLYCPLTDDAQCFALVKKLGVMLTPPLESRPAWFAGWNIGITALNTDANRAICECVARMQQAKGGGV